MTANREVFAQDPTTYTLPNDGVAKVAEPRSDQEWNVARYEIEHFVCDGSYREGLRRILDSYLANLSQPTQRAVWVHGFYGSGKSHLVRMLEFLWRDVSFRDGSTARGLAQLPGQISDALQELTIAGAQRGGLWSAAGTLGAGSPNDPRAAILGIVLKGAGLPERVNLAQFDLWVRREGWLDSIMSGLQAQGRKYEREVQNLFVSTPLAQELIKANPAFAATPADALKLLQGQFPNLEDVTTEVMVEIMRQVFELVSADGRQPCVLLVLDELQQYLAESYERTATVQEAVEACVSRFGSDLLFVATGQSAMTATTILQKLQGRFTIHVQLQEKDIETVLRQTVLRKKPSAEDELDRVLESVRGEIDRHLGGSKIGPQSTDAAVLGADYPLLPTRRRFWYQVLRQVDRGGAATQLRTQLRLAFEAAKTAGNEQLGCVVGGDFIFDQQRTTLLQTHVLLNEVNEKIAEQDDGSEDGRLRQRICALLFLIEELEETLGVRATPDTLADLLVTDLRAGSSTLRQKIPVLLDQLLDRGVITQVGEEYRVQTREGAEWDGDYRSKAGQKRGDDAAISMERERVLRQAVEGALKGMNLPQGASKTARQFELHFGLDQPVVESKVPIWVRSGWDLGEPAVKKEAAEAGADSPIVFVYLPRQVADELKVQIAGYLAAKEVLDTRPIPTTDEGRAAKSGIESRLKTHEANVNDAVAGVLDDARVFQGGGNEVTGMDLRAMIESASQSALIRLFYRFNDADYASWSKVSDKARAGAPDALEAIAYTGDVGQHPVCREILAFVGTVGKQGNDIRKQFEGPPYGWPRDAVDASLQVLTASGHLRATYRAEQVGAAQITGTTVQQTEFRAEQNVISVKERLEIRQLLGATGTKYSAGGEATAVRDMLEAMTRLAESAGGLAPLPSKPSTEYIDDLKALSGNDLLAAVHDRREQITADFSAWTELRKRTEQRMPKWTRLQALLQDAKTLPVCDEIAAEAQAVNDGRKLLADPDPVPPLVSRVSDALRKAVVEARERHLEAYDAKIEELTEDETWRQLDPAKQDEIRSRRSLVALPPLNVETEDALLSELDDTPLPSWEDKTAAVAERVTQALLDAAKELEPKSKRVALPSATIRDAAELDAYLDDVRRRALDEIEKGNPVVLP